MSKRIAALFSPESRSSRCRRLPRLPRRHPWMQSLRLRPLRLVGLWPVVSQSWARRRTLNCGYRRPPLSIWPTASVQRPEAEPRRRWPKRCPRRGLRLGWGPGWRIRIRSSLTRRGESDRPPALTSFRRQRPVGRVRPCFLSPRRRRHHWRKRPGRTAAEERWAVHRLNGKLVNQNDN